MSNTLTTPLDIEGLPDPTVERLRVDQLKVDPTYQRHLDHAWVERKLPLFNRSLLGIITVARRDGADYIVDGQHRQELIRQARHALGIEVDEVTCNVYVGLTPEQEARLFLGLNAARVVSPFDRFRAAIAAKDETATNIVHILDGLELGYSRQRNSKGEINAVVALQKVYGFVRADKHVGPAVLRHTLDTLKRTWGKNMASFDRSLIEGLGLFYLSFMGKVDEDRLIEALQGYPGGPRGIKARARMQREVNNRPLARNVASVIVGAYNKGRSKGSVKDPFT